MKDMDTPLIDRIKSNITIYLIVILGYTFADKEPILNLMSQTYEEYSFINYILEIPVIIVNIINTFWMMYNISKNKLK